MVQAFTQLPADMAGCEAIFASMSGPDPRADDLRREVTIFATRVAIERRFRGIDMRVSVPVETYEGVLRRRETGA